MAPQEGSGNFHEEVAGYRCEAHQMKVAKEATNLDWKQDLKSEQADRRAALKGCSTRSGSGCQP